MHTATSSTPVDERGLAQTRWEDICCLEAALGGEFVLDVCASAGTAKAKKWFGPGSNISVGDALASSDWVGDGMLSYTAIGAPTVRKMIYCNPDFCEIDKWFSRCESYRDRVTVVGCCPYDVTTRWWKNWVEKANYIIIPMCEGKGSRRTFLRPDGSEFTSVDKRTGKVKLASPSGSVVWVVWGMPRVVQPQYIWVNFTRIERRL